ncbi:hypothetical protein THAOC_18315, partial [Thalassiosira oceanica]
MPSFQAELPTPDLALEDERVVVPHVPHHLPPVHAPPALRRRLRQPHAVAAVPPGPPRRLPPPRLERREESLAPLPPRRALVAVLVAYLVPEPLHVPLAREVHHVAEGVAAERLVVVAASAAGVSEPSTPRPSRQAGEVVRHVRRRDVGVRVESPLVPVVPPAVVEFLRVREPELQLVEGRQRRLVLAVAGVRPLLGVAVGPVPALGPREPPPPVEVSEAPRVRRDEPDPRTAVVTVAGVQARRARRHAVP